MSSMCILESGLGPSSESYETHDQSCKPCQSKSEAIPSEHSPISTSLQSRYKPLKLPPVLHEFPPKYHKYLPVFDGEEGSLTAERHLQYFEHFIDLFEVEHDDVCMRVFAQSLRGNVKQWFRHLLPESISSWEELSHVFLRFWGRRRSWDEYIVEFHAMSRLSEETVSSFSRRFVALYYDMPKEIQPPEGAAKLQYAQAFQPNFALLLLERRSVSLLQMFNDAQEVDENLQASQRAVKRSQREQSMSEQCETVPENACEAQKPVIEGSSRSNLEIIF